MLSNLESTLGGGDTPGTTHGTRSSIADINDRASTTSWRHTKAMLSNTGLSKFKTNEKGEPGVPNSPPIMASGQLSQKAVDVSLCRLFGLGRVFEGLGDRLDRSPCCSLVSLQLGSSSHPSQVEGTFDCDVVSEIVDRLLAGEGLFEVFLCHGRQVPCDLLGQAVELGIVTWDEFPAFGRPATAAPAGAGLGLGWANELQSRVGVKGTEVVEKGSFGPCASDVDLHVQNSVWCGVVRVGLTGPPGFPSLTKDCFRGVGVVNRASTHTQPHTDVRQRTQFRTINGGTALETI